MDRVILKHHHVTERKPQGLDLKRAHESASTVRMVKEGDVVRALEVTCACGERITIELAYDADARPKPAARAA